MKILLNLLLGMPESPPAALSIGEEEGCLCVALIGSLPTSYLTDEGKVWSIQSGYVELIDMHDIEEIGDAVNSIHAIKGSASIGAELPEALAYEVRRIADVLYGAWAEEASIR
jgi:hypothetical protein